MVQFIFEVGVAAIMAMLFACALYTLIASLV